MGEIYSKKEVGNRLRDIRCKLDLTQEQFAEILDISPQLYKKMESGENNISLNTLKKMKTKLNFSTDYLLFGEKEELAEIWNKTLALQDMEKEILLIKLFCDISMNGNHMETKETAEKYNMIFQKIKEAMTDGDKDGKESPDIGRQ
ncbi:MAG: helix-turn-helix domain-containing protein [Lachnospiraceae bacterium]|nr:helix-turn-helix domain-containing protein [Lachnospiraceae bacterium]